MGKLIDMIGKDSSGGYTASNVVTSCIECNKAKLDMPYDKFVSLVHMIHSNMLEK